MSHHKRVWSLGVALLLSVALLAAWVLLLGVKVSEATAQPPGAAQLVSLTGDYCVPPFCLAWTVEENYGTRSVAWVDYDGDGDLDLASAASGAIFLYRNDGGTLTAASVLDLTNVDVYDMAWGDMDRDGDLDLALASAIPNTNRIYRNNNGIWELDTEWNPQTGESTFAIAWGDYDRDGYLDLAVGGGYGSTVCLHLYLYHNGQGNMANTASFTSTSCVNVWDLAWADMNCDGYLDLAVGNRLYANHLYLNVEMAGTRTLSQTTWSDNPIVDNTRSLAWGDLDNDGDLDLAVGNVGLNYVYRNENGALSSTPVWTSTTSQWWETTSDVAWVDVDGDGYLDLAVTNGGYFSSEPNRVYRNDNGVLTSESVWTSIEIEKTFAADWGDVDGDGDWDWVVGNYGYDRVYYNEGGVLAPSAFMTSTESDVTTAVAWGDVDRDGDLDLAVANGCIISGTGSANQVYLNENGNLVDSTPPWMSSELACSRSVAWGDVNGDGYLDLAVGNGSSSPYHTSSGPPNRVYLNARGMLTSTGAWTSTEEDNTRSVAWGDYDGDGDLDLAVGNVAGPNRLYRNDTSPGSGQATFTLVWSSAESDATWSVAWGDVDGDGDLDLAVGNGNAVQYQAYPRRFADVSEVNRLYRNENGTLTRSAVWSSVEREVTWSVAWADVDGDGDLDLAAGNAGVNGQRNRLYRNEGGMLTDSAAWSSTESDWTYSLAWGDYDGDGDPDLAVGNGRSPTLEIGGGRGLPNRLYRNDNGTLTSRAVWSSNDTDATWGIAWGDVNGDGDLDLIAGNGDSWRDSDEAALGPQPNRVYQNLRDGRAFEGAIPTVQLAPIAPLLNANFVYTDPALRAPTFTFSYTLADPYSRTVRAISVTYSLDGGGQWFPAIAAAGTLTQNLSTGTNALAFDGVDDYVDLPDMNPDYANGLTIGAWVYYDSFQRWSRIADFGNGPAANNIFLANRLTSNDLVLGVYQGSTEHLVIAPQVLETGRWIHIAGTIAADGSVRLYRDGTQVAAGTLPLPSLLTRTQNYIGRSNWSGDGYLDGSLYDVRLYNRVLAPAEVVTLAHNGEPDTAGLVGHWPLDEGAGTIAHDQIAAHHGTLVNGPLWVRRIGMEHLFTWDIFASNFFGRSDNVVLRLIAYPALTPIVGSAPVYRLPYASTTSAPFRVRGMQVRVISETTPASNALVYRLLAGQTGGGMPLADQAELPYRTDAQGYLQGRGQLAVGDQLVALLPVSITDTYTLYHTSAAVTATGLDAHTVLTPGVQVLTVTAAQPLILFNLDVSLEWDARQDPLYLAQLEYDLQRASEFLYDWSNGQIALGAVQIYQHREHWDTADVRIYASNRLRPNAIQGGVTASQTPDPDAPAILYTPGQVRMGVTWSRYGETGNYAEDWPRALAHELGHYLLYLDDNYLGFDAGGNLIPVDTCTGAMSDPYRGDWPYDEFHANDAAWAADCAATLSQQRTGRADWATVQRFYPQLHFADNIGPRVLPLAVTQVQWVTPTAGLPLADPLFYLVTPDGARLQPGARARAFLFQGDALVDLGRPGLDRVYARGARVGERLCVVAADAQQVGCTVIGATARQVVVHTYPDWQPDLVITPVSSRTFTVTVGNLLPGLTLHAQLYAHLGAVTAAQPLSYTEGVYQTVLHTTAPAIGGHLHLWDATQPATAPRREALTDYALGGSPGGEGDFGRGGRAPTLSSDGQAILYGPDLAFPEGEFYALQATPVLPHPPAWATVVGQAYRLLASGGAPPLTDASLSFQYLGSEVPAGEETWLKLYYWDGSLWQQLPTQVNTDYNTAVAPVQGAGLYALMASLEIPLPMEGWNNFAYPVNATRPVTEALLSITDYYTTVYGYQRGEWLIYDKGIQPVGLNTLGALEFGQGYWISVTQAITLNLRGTNNPALLGSGSAPVPATYYGEVRAGANFTPTAGQVVQAWVGGQLCGETETRALAGKIWYLLPVAAGCGGPGQAVQFRVEGRAFLPLASWSNTQAHAWPLTPDQAPLADAGPDQNLDTLASVILNGSASSDPDGDYPLVYHWTQTGGPPVAFTPHMSVTTFTAPTDPTVLTFTLTVTDSLGLTSLPDTVTITVEGYRIYLPLTLRQ